MMMTMIRKGTDDNDDDGDDDDNEKNSTSTKSYCQNGKKGDFFNRHRTN